MGEIWSLLEFSQNIMWNLEFSISEALVFSCSSERHTYLYCSHEETDWMHLLERRKKIVCVPVQPSWRKYGIWFSLSIHFYIIFKAPADFVTKTISAALWKSFNYYGTFKNLGKVSHVRFRGKKWKQQKKVTTFCKNKFSNKSFLVSACDVL